MKVKTLDKYHQLSHIDWVFEPRYHDKKILIMKRKVNRRGDFSLKFVKCKAYPNTYYIAGKDLRKSKVELVKDKYGNYNEFYALDIDKLEQLERVENSQLYL